MTVAERNCRAPSGALVVSGADVVAEARKWLGVRFKHQGRDRDGVDCVGMAGQVGRSLALIDFDIRDYLRHATDEQMLQICLERLLRVTEARPGDLGVIRYDGSRHMVIFGDHPAGGLTLIHAYSRAPRRVVEHRFDDTWLRSEKASLIGVFRFPGVVA